MKTTVTCHDFVEAFRRVRPDQFSVPALRALFEYLEELESDTGSEIELDVVSLCCDFCEYDSAIKAVIEFEVRDELESDDEFEAVCLQWLRDQTQVVEFDGGIVVQNF